MNLTPYRTAVLLPCSPTEHLTPDHCSRMSFTVSVPGGLESTRPYFIDPVRQEVQRRGASFREETVALEDAGAFLSGLTSARKRCGCCGWVHRWETWHPTGQSRL